MHNKCQPNFFGKNDMLLLGGVPAYKNLPALPDFRFNLIKHLPPYYRISKTAWIKREEDDAIENIYKRVGAVTGLNMETSEELQVSNYGIGGHYEPHFDFARREETNAFTSLGTGNRIATWLFYVSFGENYEIFILKGGFSKLSGMRIVCK